MWEAARHPRAPCLSGAISGLRPGRRLECPSRSGHGRRNARISAQLSLRLDARLADDFPPLRHFRPEAGGAFLGRAGDRLVTERRQAFLHVRPDDGLCNVPLQQRDDVLGVPAGTTTANHDSPATSG